MHRSHLTQLSRDPACFLHLSAFQFFLGIFYKKSREVGVPPTAHISECCADTVSYVNFSSCCRFTDYYLLATWVEQRTTKYSNGESEEVISRG